MLSYPRLWLPWQAIDLADSLSSAWLLFERFSTSAENIFRGPASPTPLSWLLGHDGSMSLALPVTAVVMSIGLPLLLSKNIPLKEMQVQGARR
mmetsp:Transcript_14917/g.27157  ORF Transcript_14917/g.27157 Transcript_14917/m.27157 type:complete len:93 (+) Transcript_14917:2932-3210(+)